MSGSCIERYSCFLINTKKIAATTTTTVNPACRRTRVFVSPYPGSNYCYKPTTFHLMAACISARRTKTFLILVERCQFYLKKKNKYKDMKMYTNPYIEKSRLQNMAMLTEQSVGAQKYKQFIVGKCIIIQN